MNPDEIMAAIGKGSEVNSDSIKILEKLIEAETRRVNEKNAVLMLGDIFDGLGIMQKDMLGAAVQLKYAHERMKAKLDEQWLGIMHELLQFTKNGMKRGLTEEAIRTDWEAKIRAEANA